MLDRPAYLITLFLYIHGYFDFIKQKYYCTTKRYNIHWYKISIKIVKFQAILQFCSLPSPVTIRYVGYVESLATPYLESPWYILNKLIFSYLTCIYFEWYKFPINFFFWLLKRLAAGIPYTAHGAQIIPPPFFIFILILG